MLRIIYRLLSFFVLFGSFLSAKAIDERYAARELSGNSLAPDSISFVMDEVYFNASLKPLQTTWFVKNIITFQVNEEYRHMLPDEFNAHIQFRIRYTQDVNGTEVTTDSDPMTLDIEYTKYTTYKFKDVYLAANWYKVEIIIDTIWDTDGNINAFKDALKLTNEILINREYDFTCTNNAVHTISDSLVTAKSELCVFWDQERAADEYDLEWTFIDSLALANYNTANTAGINNLFKNNGTRVSITRESYHIPLLYESSGCIFFRVRAVQVKRNGQRIESMWSSDYSGGLGAYGFAGLDPALNWQASTSFAEEGKRKSVVQYFDGSLKSRQTVTKDNTTDTTIIAETLYDHQGRPVIQVMPTPSLSSIIKYTPGFNQLNDPNSEYHQLRYDSLLVDTCNCKVGAPAMATTSGASQYYSPANPLAARDHHKYIPDAEGYVFAETKYLPDNTGRISAQGGVGETFKIGSGHETSYTYNKADQEELDALFGTEVGNASHYFKNTVQDANGQISISYVDMHGRTIATALAGTPPVKVDALASNKPNFILKSLIDSNSNVIKGTVIESSNGLFVTKAGMHKFKYSLFPDSISIKACDNSKICYDCVYDLQITITEECNDSTRNDQPPFVITRSNQIDTSCGTVNTFPSVEESVYLRQGSYVVTKTLTINKAAMDYYREIFLAKNTCTSLEQTIRQEKTLLQSIIECAPSCLSCRAGVGDIATFRQNYWQQLGISGADTLNYILQAHTAYAKQLAECDKLCDNTGLHQSIREQMLADVTPPFGQYANPDQIDQHSIFATDIFGTPAYRNAGFYRDESGNIDLGLPQFMNQEQFAAEFKNSWATTLLHLHPEYAKLQKFEALAVSNIWDEHFANTETYQAAVDSGFLNPGDFISRPSGTIFNHNASHRDPFFTDYINDGTIGSNYKSEMQDSLLVKSHDEYNAPISIWSLATIMAHCPDRDKACLDAYKPINSAFTIGSDCSGDLDIAWQYFREMYLQEKRELVDRLLNAEWQLQPNYASYLTLVANSHTLNFNDPYVTLPETITPDSTSGRDSLQLFVNNNCAAYAEQWMNELGSCYDSDARAWIIPRLIEVCREGGDENHPFGASTVKPSSTYQYKSFEEVIKAYRDGNGNPAPYNSTCNVYLITAPAPYDQQPVYYDKPVFQKPDSCECATISALYEKFQEVDKDATFSDYIYRTTGTRMYQGVLDTLRMACNGQINCSFLKDPLVLPPLLQCGGGNVCVNCDRVDTLYKKYVTQFPDATPVANTEDSLQLEKNKLFERYMNTALGFVKTTGDYLKFMQDCGVTGPTKCDTLRKILNGFTTIRLNDSTHFNLPYIVADTTTFTRSEVFKDGVAHVPDQYYNSANGYGAHYLKTDTLCPGNVFTFVTRVKKPAREINRSELVVQVHINEDGTDIFKILGPVFKMFGQNRTAEDTAVIMTYSGMIGYGTWFLPTNPKPVDWFDWVEVKITHSEDSIWRVYVNDTLLNQLYIPTRVTRIVGWQVIFNGRVNNGYVDHVRIYDQNNKLQYAEEFEDARQSPSNNPAAYQCEETCQTKFTNYYNQTANTSLTYAQIQQVYTNCGLSLDPCSYTLTCDTLTKWMADYKKYGDVPHLDASGSDTTHWKANFGGWHYTLPVPLDHLIRNGSLSFPATYPNAGFDYRDDTLCLDSAGFTWEARIKMPDSVANYTNVGATTWFWLYTDPNIGSGDLLMAISKIDGRGVAVCTHNNEPIRECLNEPVPGQHFNEWRTIKFQVRGRNFKYLINDTLVAQRTLDNYFTKLNHWTIQPFGNRIEVDYVRIYDTAGNMYYNENFDDARNLAKISNKGQCLPCDVRFARYFNERNNTNYTYEQIDAIYYNGCGAHLNLCTEPLTLCGRTEPVFPPVVLNQHSTCDDSTLFSNSTGTLIYDAYHEALVGEFNDRYLAKCLSARYHETFTVYQPISEFHYTLYYYDQAGNLLKTIPPEGVDVSKFPYARAWSDSVRTARSNKQLLTPDHKLPTQYRYNTLNQVKAQRSPDGRLSEFWYDRLGRLVISRNARQYYASLTEEGRLYSYTQYDQLGRITEVGQVSNLIANGGMTDAVSRDNGVLRNWLTNLNSRRGQITNTVYDLPYPGFVNVPDQRMVITQRNLRNRVSYTTITDTGTNNNHNQGTFYTYDILGNVDHLLQDYGRPDDNATVNVMNKNGNRWKKISYEYDLISGKVNMVIFQQSWRDAFFHRYGYDAENRLTLVETSRDSLIWEKDARYEYYRHGPLARVTLGEQQVQGVDYAYTLQGWLKGINSTGGTETHDMGADGKAGSLNQFTARDAMGLTLNYFGNEYTAINGTPFPGYSGKYPNSDEFRPLFNGNISSTSVYQKKFEGEPGGPLIFYNYKYDQLNRLTQQDAFTGFNAAANEWNHPMTPMGEPLKERIAYDANGNILKYLRNSIKTTSQSQMDSLTYSYYPKTNQLRRITDKVLPGTFTDADNRIVDIDSQPEDNYVYDSIGNLIEDKQENISSIKWTVYGKIAEITRTATATVPASNIKYTYDASGNRISQIVTTGGTKNYTWYVRDAQGNMLATYTAEGNNTDLKALPLQLADRFLYGSSRLGTLSVNDNNIDDNGPASNEYYYEDRKFPFERGYKNYELTNHLGNVLATVSDRKFGVSSGGSSLIDYYNPHIVTAQDYYPFGMLSRVSLPGSGKSYRFGFNGKENDNDVKGGLGNQQDYGMRIYDPRIGKFLSVDPISKNYPELTPYQYASNTPIWAVDLDGLESALTGPGMTHNTAGRALGEYLNEPAPLWMRRTLAAQANYESRGVELTEDDFEGTTRGGFYLLSAGFSLSRWAQSNPGTLKIPNTRRVPQHPDVEVPANTTKPKQGVTASEEVPIVTDKQATASNKLPIHGDAGVILSKYRSALAGDISAAAELRVAKMLRQEGKLVFIKDHNKGMANKTGTFDFEVYSWDFSPKNVDVKRISGLGKNTAGDLAKGVKQVGAGGEVIVVRPADAKQTYGEYVDFVNKFTPQQPVSFRVVNEADLPKLDK
jgi:RHS repeat-associated protein